MNDQPTTPAGSGTAVLVPTADTLHDRATQHLAALGDTPEQVAATLAEHGCLGIPGNCARCPVAVYLMRSDLDLRNVSVDGVVAILFPGDEDYVYLDLPDPVIAFVDRFDHDDFPQLRGPAVTR
jgi:hypothetical protein